MTASLGPVANIREEACRVLAAAKDAGVTTRLLGGVAIALLAREPLPEPLRRAYQDIDLAVKQNDTPKLRTLLDEIGYTPNRQFNNLHGERRLLFYDEVAHRQIDVFVGRFKMCHTLDFNDQLTRAPETLAPADLLLTKLQIVEINRKDLLDAVALLWACDTSTDPSAQAIDLSRVAKITSRDWGWYTTLSDNLQLVGPLVSETLDEVDARMVIERVRTIRETVEAAPKSIGWKTRAALGRRVQWYELPEEVGG